MDIYLDASHLGIYPPLFTSPSGESCILLVWIRNCYSQQDETLTDSIQRRFHVCLLFKLLIECCFVLAIVRVKGFPVLIFLHKIVNKCLFKLCQYVFPNATQTRTFIYTVFTLRKEKLQFTTGDATNFNVTKAAYMKEYPNQQVNWINDLKRGNLRCLRKEGEL